MVFTISFVVPGVTVLFMTTKCHSSLFFNASPIIFDASITYLRSMLPSSLLGVPTVMNVTLELWTAFMGSSVTVKRPFSMSVFISSSSPGSNIGDFPDFNRFSFSVSISNPMTGMFLCANTAA